MHFTIRKVGKDYDFSPNLWGCVVFIHLFFCSYNVSNKLMGHNSYTYIYLKVFLLLLKNALCIKHNNSVVKRMKYLIIFLFCLDNTVIKASVLILWKFYFQSKTKYEISNPNSWGKSENYIEQSRFLKWVHSLKYSAISVSGKSFEKYFLK